MSLLIPNINFVVLGHSNLISKFHECISDNKIKRIAELATMVLLQ